MYKRQHLLQPALPVHIRMSCGPKATPSPVVPAVSVLTKMSAAGVGTSPLLKVHVTVSSFSSRIVAVAVAVFSGELASSQTRPVRGQPGDAAAGTG